jgi:hypothetical protein
MTEAGQKEQVADWISICRETTARVTEESSMVRLASIESMGDILEQKGLFRAIEAYKQGGQVCCQDPYSHPVGMDDERAATWVFIRDALNFSFWVDNGEPYSIRWRGAEYRGYRAFCAGMRKLWDAGIWIMDSSKEQLLEIFGKDLPMLEERWEILVELRQILAAKYRGSFANVLRDADHSIAVLVDILVKEFPCFRDWVQDYNGGRVCFL